MCIFAIYDQEFQERCQGDNWEVPVIELVTWNDRDRLDDLRMKMFLLNEQVLERQQ